MIPRDEAIQGVYGALQLAKGRRDGFLSFDNSIYGYWQSFYAAVICAPFHFILALLIFTDPDQSAGILRYMTVEVIAYVMSWTAYPLAAYYMARSLGRDDRYMQLIIAHNWASVVMLLAFFPIGLMLGMDIQSGMLNFLQTVYLVAVITYKWFIVKTALDVAGPMALGFVAADFIIFIVISRWAVSLTG